MAPKKIQPEKPAGKEKDSKATAAADRKTMRAASRKTMYTRGHGGGQ
jgi:hypothetical protein